MTRAAPCVVMSMAAAILLALVTCGPPPYGFKGTVYVREADGSTGPPVAGAEIEFARVRDGKVKRVTSNGSGAYQAPVSPGEYRFAAWHEEYEDFLSRPATHVAGEDQRTLDIFLREPRLTTVLLVRHAEKGQPAPIDMDTPLSPAGETRSLELSHVVENGGVSAIYATPYTRTYQTVEPTASLLNLDIELEAATDTLVNDKLLARHRGDVVLIASHSGPFPGGTFSSVPGIITALGASGCQGAVMEYDNLYLVSRTADGTNRTSILNLQFGRSDTSDPADYVNCKRRMTTVLLVPPAEEGSAGQARGMALAHVVGKAGVVAIFAPDPGAEPAASLSSVLNLAVTAYNSGDISRLADGLPDPLKGHSVVVVANADGMVAIAEELGASPVPSFGPRDHDNLFVLTIAPATQPRVIGLQYGDGSPR